MTVSYREQFNKVFAQLKGDGLLLTSDLTYLITKERIRGSWWSHKLAHTIFSVAEMLDDHPEVMIMKLVSGKVTFVYRDLWNHIYSIGVAREEWQRSEERRVGKECRARWEPYHYTKKQKNRR